MFVDCISADEAFNNPEMASCSECNGAGYTRASVIRFLPLIVISASVAGIALLIDSTLSVPTTFSALKTILRLVEGLCAMVIVSAVLSITWKRKCTSCDGTGVHINRPPRSTPFFPQIPVIEQDELQCPNCGYRLFDGCSKVCPECGFVAIGSEHYAQDHEL